MTNTLASMIQREQDTDPEKRNALASDINWVTPNVGQVVPKWVSASDAPWIERAYRDVKDIGDVVARGALDLPNKLMMAVTDREAPAWALRNLTPAGQMVQGANQFAAGLRGTEVAENIWDQPEPLADAPWLQRAGNMATGIANMALAYAPMEKAVGGAVGSIGAKVANKWPMQKGIYVGPKSKAWTARPQIGTEGETVPEGAFSSLYDRKPRVEIDDSGARLSTFSGISDSGDTNIEHLRDVINTESLVDLIDDIRSGQTGSRVLGKASQLIDSNTSPIKGSSQGMIASSDALRDIISSNSFLNKGYGGLDVETQRSVLSLMLNSVKDAEIFDTVVKLIPIDVVDALRAQKLTPEMILHDPSMLSSAITENLGHIVPGGVDVSGSLVKAVALARAIKDSGKGSIDSALMSKNLGSTNTTINNGHIPDLLGNYNTLVNKPNQGEKVNLTPPYSSENIPVNEAIVRFDRNGPQAMVRPGEGGQVEGYVEGSERDANFKKWFGDSKVVDENGEPLTVYKGMPVNNYENNQPIEYIQRQTEFPAFYKNEPSIKIAGFFSNNPEVANRFASIITKNGEGNGVFPVNISFKKPFVIDAKGDHAGNIEFGESGKMFRDAVRSGKYDGVIIKNTADEGDVYVTLQPNQSKSIFNRGTFDPKDPRILYGAGAGLAAYNSTQDSKDVSDAPWLRNEKNIK